MFTGTLDEIKRVLLDECRNYDCYPYERIVLRAHSSGNLAVTYENNEVLIYGESVVYLILTSNE